MTSATFIGFRRHRRAFTLVELLVVIGIALLLMGILLPSINRAYNDSVRTKMTLDIQAIVTAIEAYRQDHADIPRIYGSGTNPNHTGAVILCKALLAPQAVGLDGHEGLGFRSLPAIAGVPQGRLYGPYLAPDKFKIDNNANTPRILDRNGKPILYFVGSKTAAIAQNGGYIGTIPAPASGEPPPYPYNNTNPALVRPMFNPLDVGSNGANMNVFDHTQGSDSKRGARKFRYLMGCNPVSGGINGTKPDGSAYGPALYVGDYIVWSAGPDELYGLPNDAVPGPSNQCDDVANFPRSRF